MMLSARREDLKAIFQAGLNRVDPYRMLVDHVRLDGDILAVRLGDEERMFDLAPYRTVLIIGAGKATAPMALAMERILGDRLDGGTIVVKYGHVETLAKVDIVEADHPVPDENGRRGAEKILALADRADQSTLVISLISGGGSALLPLPFNGRDGHRDYAVSLEDKQKTTGLLLSCGADIEEINCIRKHLSLIKGGRLLERLAPARSINFILSDVVGDALSSIASGITCGDPTTYDDAWRILEKYGIDRDIPETVRDVLQAGLRGDLPETLKPGSDHLLLTENILIGTNIEALNSAAEEARKRGYRVVRLTSRITGEAREIAKLLAGIAIDCAAQSTIAAPPVCILSGGEPVVQIRGAGKGGRNQEMALAYLLEIARHKALCTSICFLAASTDGNDGPTDAAGGFADLDLLAKAQRLGLDPLKFLGDNDSYHFLEQCEGLLKTGPTNTNVCDLHLSLITAESQGN
ncbi:MAG: glycerate kinase [Desulfofustis sp.]|nr:glycerate kinase [Desulfofustis sp.]